MFRISNQLRQPVGATTKPDKNASCVRKPLRAINISWSLIAYY
jgi:hypothetical protein